MMARAIQVVWNDKVIGTIPEPKQDNFFIYGSWKRVASPETWQALLDALDTEGEVLVELRAAGEPGWRGSWSSRTKARIEVHLGSLTLAIACRANAARSPPAGRAPPLLALAEQPLGGIAREPRGRDGKCAFTSSSHIGNSLGGRRD